MMGAPVAVTGLGVITPHGPGTDVFWKASVEGLCAIGPLSRFESADYPLRLAGEIRDFALDQVLEASVVVQTDRFTQLALAAAEQALRDASLESGAVAPYQFGVVTASCAGGVEFGQREIEALWRRGPRYVGPYQSIAWFYAASTGQISIRHGLKGPCGVLVTDEAGALDAIAHACRDIRYGASAMLAGGAEAPFAPFSMTCQYPLGVLSSGTDPSTAYAPFTTRADGFVPAEGGAMLLLEAEPAARRRGARCYAQVAGHGTTFTGAGRPEQSAAGLAYAAQLALAEAGCAPAEVDVVFADAFGTAAADRAEAAALRQVFGPRASRVPVTAPKTGIGRAYAGAAAIDVATAVLALTHGVIPPTPNLTARDLAPELALDLVTGQARPVPLGTALVWARGLSGTNSALVIRGSG